MGYGAQAISRFFKKRWIPCEKYAIVKIHLFSGYGRLVPVFRHFANFPRKKNAAQQEKGRRIESPAKFSNPIIDKWKRMF